MDNNKKNKHIMRKFRIKSAVDNLPYACTQRVNREHLGIIYKDFGYTVGAEIGVHKGHHARVMLKKNPDMKLYGIDPYIQYKLGRKVRRTQKMQNNIFEYAKKYLEGYNIEFVRKTSMDALNDFEDGSLDFVYIDGDHQFDYVMTDLIFWNKKVKPGGIVALHDYCHFHWSGIIRAVDAFTYCHDIRPWFITKESKPTVFWVKP